MLGQTERLTHPNLLVSFLTIPAFLHNSHDHILRRHERQFLRNSPGDDFGINDQTLRDILQSRKDDICSQECLGKGNPTVCTIGVR